MREPVVDSGTIKPCLRCEDGEVRERGVGGVHFFTTEGNNTGGGKKKKTPLNTLDSLGFCVSASVCEMSTKAEQCEYGRVSPVMSPALRRICLPPGGFVFSPERV